MARSVSGWLRLHEQTEIDNLSELKLPYKVSLYRGRDGQKCIFWPQFPFFLPGGLFFPTFYPISLTLWFSLRFWQCRQFRCHCTCGWKPYFRNNRGCKRTAFSEANGSVHLIYSTQKTASSAKHCLLGLVWSPEHGLVGPWASCLPGISLTARCSVRPRGL